MDKVQPGLWIGNAREARDASVLASIGVAAVVDISANEEPAQLPREFIYSRVPLVDGADNSDDWLLLAIQTLRNLIRAEVPTIIACSYGMSRAPTVTAFAVAAETGESPEDVVSRVAEQRHLDVNPSLWAHAKRIVESETDS